MSDSWWQVQDEEAQRYFEECQEKLKQDLDYEPWLKKLDSQTPNGSETMKKPITNYTEQET